MDDGSEACVDFVDAQGDALELLKLPNKFSIRRRHLYLRAPFVEIGDTKTERIRHGD